jgi:hypothetical protein
MMSTLLFIIGVLVSLSLILLFIILFTPFTFRTEFAVSSEYNHGTIFFSWIHPFIARVTYTIGDNDPEVRIFGRQWRWLGEKLTQARTAGKKETEVVREKAPDPVPEKTVPVSPRSGSAVQTGISSHQSKTETPAQSPGGNTPGHGEAAAPSLKEGAGTLRRRIAALYHKIKITWTVLRRHRMASRSFRWCLRLLKLFFGLVRFDHFRLHAMAGMEDPAALGKIYGWYGAANSALFGKKKNVDIRFEPRFQGAELALDGSIGLRTSIARILTPLIVALVTFPYIRVFLVWRRIRKVYR